MHAERQGVNIEYSLTDDRLIQALDLLREVLRGRISYRCGLIETERTATDYVNR